MSDWPDQQIPNLLSKVSRHGQRNNTLSFSLCIVNSNGSNALVICNHAPSPAPGRAGDSRGNERGFDQSFATAVQGKYPGLLYIGKKGHEMNRWQAVGENSSGFTKEQSPQGGAFSRDLLVQKSNSPLFPGAEGGGRGYKQLVHNRYVCFYRYNNCIKIFLHYKVLHYIYA